MEIPAHDWDVVCGACGVAVEEHSYCAGCRMVRYCGRRCQRDHWPQHRLVCALFAELRAVYRAEVPHMDILAEQFPDDATGVLALTFPVGVGARYRFTIGVPMVSFGRGVTRCDRLSRR